MSVDLPVNEFFKFNIGKRYKLVGEAEDERLAFFNRWSDPAYCLEAVKQNGYALKYVKEQTEELCLEAVKENGDALRYVKEQTEKICLEAVKQNSYSLRYVRDKTIFEKITGLKIT